MLWTQTGLEVEEEEEEVCVSGERPNHTRTAVVREKLIAEIYMINYIFDQRKCMSVYNLGLQDYMFLPCFTLNDVIPGTSTVKDFVHYFLHYL